MIVVYPAMLLDAVQGSPSRRLRCYSLRLWAGLGWAVRPAVHIAIFVATIGAIHEATEIVTHSHAFETEDAIVNAIGALIGVAIQRTMQRAITQ